MRCLETFSWFSKFICILRNHIAKLKIFELRFSIFCVYVLGLFQITTPVGRRCLVKNMLISKESWRLQSASFRSSCHVIQCSSSIQPLLKFTKDRKATTLLSRYLKSTNFNNARRSKSKCFLSFSLLQGNFNKISS